MKFLDWVSAGVKERNQRRITEKLLTSLKSYLRFNASLD